MLSQAERGGGEQPAALGRSRQPPRIESRAGRDNGPVHVGRLAAWDIGYVLARGRVDDLEGLAVERRDSLSPDELSLYVKDSHGAREPSDAAGRCPVRLNKPGPWLGNRRAAVSDDPQHPGRLLGPVDEAMRRIRVERDVVPAPQGLDAAIELHDDLTGDHDAVVAA